MAPYSNLYYCMAPAAVLLPTVVCQDASRAGENVLAMCGFTRSYSSVAPLTQTVRHSDEFCKAVD